MSSADAPLLRELVANRYTILQLARRDFRTRYAGSMLGLLWAFLQPLAMMSILWFVFSFGLKTQPVEPGVSFIAWFFAASVAWNFFQDSILLTSNAINDYAFLVRKVNFKVRLLPIVKLGSALTLHLIFIGILIVVLLINGYRPTWYWLQVGYYLTCSFALALGLGWLLSALNVFTRDVGQVIGIVLQFGFWLTPIIWNFKMLPAPYQDIAKLNPVFYITEGYRNSFVYGVGIADHGLKAGLYFWLVTISLLVIGHKVFMRLRPHFGDVL